MPARLHYSATRRIYVRYWQAYGGWSALLHSLYAHAALGLTFCLWGQWTKEGWWENVLSVAPSVFGFSIGGYALLLSFGDEKFQKLMANAKVRESNAFVDLCAAFTHFVLMQFFALVIALVAKGVFVVPPHWLGNWPVWLWTMIGIIRYLLWFFGELIFIYAILCGAAATMRIFRLAEMFAKAAKEPVPDDEK